jgi:hypothetical protein
VIPTVRLAMAPASVFWHKAFRCQSCEASTLDAQVLEGKRSIGVMVESFLVAGCQDFMDRAALSSGQSVTDACVGWEMTVPVLRQLIGCLELTNPRRGRLQGNLNSLIELKVFTRRGNAKAALSRSLFTRQGKHHQRGVLPSACPWVFLPIQQANEGEERFDAQLLFGGTGARQEPEQDAVCLLGWKASDCRARSGLDMLTSVAQL